MRVYVHKQTSNVLISFLITVIGTCGRTLLTCVAIDSSAVSKAKFPWSPLVLVALLVLAGSSPLSWAASKQHEQAGPRWVLISALGVLKYTSGIFKRCYFSSASTRENNNSTTGLRTVSTSERCVLVAVNIDLFWKDVPKIEVTLIIKISFCILYFLLCVEFRSTYFKYVSHKLKKAIKQ